MSKSPSPSKTESDEIAKAPNVEPFQAKGKSEDEVTLRFDDGRELYVSASFLKEVSPVFEAMLGQNFKEGKTRTVELKGKKFEDILDFLQLLHPHKFKPITESNVWNIIPLAEEYQVPRAKHDCKIVVREWLRKYSHLADTSKSTMKFDAKCFMSLCTYLPILCKFSYDEDVEDATDILSAFQVGHYLRRNSEFASGTVDLASYSSPLNDYSKKFNVLPDKIQLQIVFKRIARTKESEIV